jgi:Fe2+ or Zn2+ uptake regulation protein
MTLTDDRALRRKILSLLYAAWKIRGKEGFLSQNELVKDTGAEPIAVARNLDLLCDLGLVEDLLSVGARFVRLTHQGILKCEDEGIEPDESLLQRRKGR